MLLVFGSPDDRLTANVHRRLVDQGVSTIWLDEPEVFAETQLSVEINRTHRSGFLQCGSETIMLHAIDGVFFRLPRVWWPSSEFDFQDQLFVYHETAASWYSFLAGLRCPQVNRFGLGWWVHDVSYADQLRRSISTALGLGTPDSSSIPQLPIRNYPTPVRKTQNSRHVYVIGDYVVPRTIGDQDLAVRLNAQKETLAHWQQETGITFCRLDFEDTGVMVIHYVEPMPMLEDEPFDTVDKIESQLVQRLS